jgi:hypothetical protein
MRSLFLIVLKCHQHLHLVIKSEITEQNIDVESNLDISEMTINCNELMRELVTRELLFFKHYHMDNEKIICPLKWWEKHESLFLIVRFLAMQILGIPRSQIETEHIFSLVGILIRFGKCCLQCNKL